MFCSSLALTATITRCTFTGNSGRSGAGIALFHSAPTLAECSFSDNAALVHGGAIFCLGAPQVIDCTFSGNTSATRGGAVWVHDESPTFTRCTFWGNGSPVGGVLYCRGTSFPTVENSIIAASVEGSAVLCVEGAGPTLSCSNVHGNAGGDWIDCLAGQLGANGNICEESLFCDPGNRDFTLAANSPCLPGNHPNGVNCGLIGAFDEGCGPIAFFPESWARVKAMYR
jgi:predicted outer membrane repeat protein